MAIYSINEVVNIEKIIDIDIDSVNEFMGILYLDESSSSSSESSSSSSESSSSSSESSSSSSSSESSSSSSESSSSSSSSESSSSESSSSSSSSESSSSSSESITFPTKGILDDFNRGNEGPPPSANWFTPTGPVGMGGLRVTGNQCMINDLNDIGHGSAFWIDSTFGPDCEAYVTGVTVPDDDTKYIRLYLRMTTTDYSTMDGYIVSFVYDSGQSVCQIFRVDNGINTKLGDDINIILSDGDKLGADITGTDPSTITAYQDTGEGWASIGSREDSDHDDAGYIGLAANDLLTTVMDDFGGGTL